MKNHIHTHVKRLLHLQCDAATFNGLLHIISISAYICLYLRKRAPQGWAERHPPSRQVRSLRLYSSEGDIYFVHLTAKCLQEQAPERLILFSS